MMSWWEAWNTRRNAREAENLAAAQAGWGPTLRLCWRRLTFRRAR